MKSIYYEPKSKESEGEKNKRKWFKHVKLIGEIDTRTSIYIEDYTYAYLHQWAKKVLSYELCLVLIGEHKKESEQVIIDGAIYVDPDLLSTGAQWIDDNMLDVIEEKRQDYFPQGEYVGWMHTQPGYGIMPTTKEMALHKEMFGDDCVLMLIDSISETEAFFISEDDSFQEKEGFCIYYEKNEKMQKYMEDHPAVEEKVKQEKDKVASDFRERGAKRKEAVDKKRRKNKMISIGITSILLGAAFVVGIYSQQQKINKLKEDVMNIHREYSEIEHKIPDYPVELVFTSSAVSEVEVKDPEEKAEPEPELELEPEPELEQKVEPKLQSQTTQDTYVVKMGDSLLSISYDHYKTIAMPKKIAEKNNIENHDRIYVGQELKLPKKAQ